MWTLGAPAMLGWLAAAIIPLVLLWWYRARRVEMKFAAMQFLERAIAREGRRRSWLQWLVVALQMLALTLLALGWGNFQWLFDRTSLGERTWQVLLVDATLSMSAASDGESQTHFEKAIAAARDVVRRSQPGDSFSLLVVRHDCDVVIGEPTTHTEQVLRELDRLQVTYEAGKFPAAVQSLLPVLQSLQKTHAGDRLNIHAFSDFQVTTWLTNQSEPDDPRRPTSQRVDEGWTSLAMALHPFNPHWQWHDVGRLGPERTMLLEITSTDGWVFPQQSTLVNIHLFESGDSANVDLSWFVDDVLVAKETVEVGGSLTHGRRFPLSSSGDHVVAVEGAGKLLSIATRRQIVVPVRERVRVLALGGRSSDIRPAAIALTSESRAGASPVDVEESLDAKLLAGDLTQYDVLLLANLPGLSPAESKRIEEYLQAGGGVIVALGDQSRPTDWAFDWLPAEVHPPEEPALMKFALSSRDQHPLFEIFRASDGGGLDSVPIWQHFSLVPRAENKPALFFADQSPAVVTSEYGSGRVVLWSIPWSSNGDAKLADGSSVPWTAIDQMPAFLPLVQETMKYVINAQESGRAGIVGERLRGGVPQSLVGNSLQIVRPDGRIDDVGIERAANRLSWSYAAADVPGIYKLRSGSSFTRKIAVNTPVSEVDQARLDPGQLGMGSVPAPSLVKQFARGFPWFRVFFAAAFLVLLTESCLTWQMGRKSA